jgi:DNA-binding CsgD family transcriptional regulator
MIGHPHAQVLRLSALSADAVGTLVRRRFPAAEDAFVRACTDASGGNPFYLRELLTTVASEATATDGPVRDQVGQFAPDSVLRSVLARLARFPEATAALARAVAVLGGDAAVWHAAALAGLELNVAVKAADALAATEILRPGEPLAFVHPLVHSAIYADIPPAERALLHGRAARIVGADVSPEVAASHLVLAPATGDDAAVEMLREAARQALAAGEADSAVRYLHRALAESPPSKVRSAVLVELGEAEAIAGAAGATKHLDQALALIDDPRERARTMLRLGWMLHKSGRIHDAATVYERGIAELSGADDDLEAELELNYLQAAWLDSDRADDAHARIAALVAQPPDGDRPTGRALLAQVAMMRVVTGQPCNEAVPILKRVLAEGALLRDEGPDSLTLWHVVGGLSWSDEVEIAESTCDAALREAVRLGAFVTTAQALYARSWPRYWRGAISDAVADAQGAVDAWRGGWGMYLPAAMYWLSSALIERDDLAAAADAVDLPEAEEQWGETAMYVLWLCARGRLALASGDPRGALDLLRRAGNLAAGFGLENPGVIPWRGDAALAAAQLGDRKAACVLAADDVRAARRFGAPRPIGMALRAYGLVERGTRGVELLREAVSVLEASPSELELARALIDLGATLRREGKRVEARASLRRGLTMVERFGALRLERQARSELEASGARPRRAALSGVAALTPSERRVAEMAADGMSNREIAQALFVTVKAVKFHLHNAYGKLDVGSRTELPAALAQWAPSAPTGSVSSRRGP